MSKVCFFPIKANDLLECSSNNICRKDSIKISHFFIDIFQKLAAVRDQREWVTTSGAHKVSGPRRSGCVSAMWWWLTCRVQSTCSQASAPVITIRKLADLA